MPEVTLQNAGGQAVGTLALDDRIFGAPVRADLVHAAVVAQLAAKRLGTHQAKTRGEVAGGGRKPYRQKGTGRARQGSTRAPQWRGGGVVFPPTPRSYRQRLNRKVRRAALFAAWSDLVTEGQLVVLEALAFEAPRTKLAAELLKTVLAPLADAVAGTVEAPVEDPEAGGPPARRKRVRRHALVLLTADEAPLQRAFANLAEVTFDYEDKVTVTYAVRQITAPYASVYDLVLADAVICSQAAIARITAEFSGDAEEGGDE